MKIPMTVFKPFQLLQFSGFFSYSKTDSCTAQEAKSIAAVIVCYSDHSQQ
jgi:hypothetical protein